MIDYNFRLLDFPAIPQHLIDLCDTDKLKLKSDTAYRNLTLIYQRNNQPVAPALTQLFELPHELESWLKKNINQEFNEASLMITAGNPDFIPHTDISADQRINYIIDPGGSDACLVFYQHLTIPDEDLPIGFRPANLEDTKEIESVKLTPGQWVQLNSRRIHGVKNINRTRKLISLHFMNGQ